MKILHIDIETSPILCYTWSLFPDRIAVSQIVERSSVLCYAAKWHGKRGVIFDSVYESSEKKMLKGAWDLLNEADAVVHYNGASFDEKKLYREFVKQGWGPPSTPKTIDLIKTCRGRFKFDSNKLENVAVELGIGEKIQNSGWHLWRGCLDNDPKAWRTMKRYNIQDTRLLEKLYNKLLPWIKNHPNLALYTKDKRPACTNCGGRSIQKRGTVKTKTQVYVRYQCQDCGTWLRDRKNSTPKDKAVLVQT